MTVELRAVKRLAGIILFLAAAILVFRSLSPLAPGTRPATTAIESKPPVPLPGALLRFAVIGDYGDGSANEARVAALVVGWNPDFVITTGDNNYYDGAASTIDDHIGQFYSSFIGDYEGKYGPGSPTNRFWPSLGNHDWKSLDCDASGCRGPYLDYFTLPGNERYYEVDYGFVHLFALDSDSAEPDGITKDSIQAGWLREELGASGACFDIVYLHHPPYSTGDHGSSEKLQWPFATWGADMVVAGHEHSYERLDASGFPYIVNGLGGRSLYAFTSEGDLPPGVTSVVRYDGNYGGMLVTVTASGLVSQLYNVDGQLIDQYMIEKECVVARAWMPTIRSE